MVQKGDPTIIQNIKKLNLDEHGFQPMSFEDGGMLFMLEMNDMKTKVQISMEEAREFIKISAFIEHYDFDADEMKKHYTPVQIKECTFNDFARVNKEDYYA